MDLIPSIVNAGVVAAAALALGWIFKGRFEEIVRRIDRHEAQEVARFDAIERRMDRHEAQEEVRFDAIERRMDRHDGQNESRFEQMQASLDGLRSDLTQLAISLGTRPRAENA